MTEQIHQRAGGPGILSPFGGVGPGRNLEINKEEDLPRHEESHDEIMARMNKISEEIGERHDRDRLMRIKETKQSRYA